MTPIMQSSSFGVYDFKSIAELHNVCFSDVPKPVFEADFFQLALYSVGDGRAFSIFLEHKQIVSPINFRKVTVSYIGGKAFVCCDVFFDIPFASADF